MDIEIIEETVEVLPEYAMIPISFQVETSLRFEHVKNGLGGFLLSEEKVETPYLKDYDAIEGPASWAKQWDISKWQVISAYLNGRRIGGALVAYHTEGLNFLDGREDMAALWDIRIHPECRGAGAGSKVFKRAITCAAKKGCRLLKIETQNNNVSACKFYAGLGCVLGAVNIHAYDKFPQEIQMIWYKNI